MREIVLLLDVDGPLGDFHSEARSLANELFGLNLTVDDFVTWDVTDILPTQEMKEEMNSAIASPGFASRIMPQPGAVEAVNKLKQICEVIYLTTPHPESITWMRERQEWLSRYFKARHDDIIHAFKKQHVNGDIFVDDRPKNIYQWSAQRNSAHALLWDMAYNRTAKNINRVHSWDQVIDLVETLRQ